MVRTVIMGEVVAELASADANERYGTLQDLTHAGQSIVDLVGAMVLAELEQRSTLPMVALRRLLEVLSRGQFEGRERFLSWR